MNLIKFLISKMHIIFLVVFILALVAYAIDSMIGAIDTAAIEMVLSTPIGDAPFWWLCLIALVAVLSNAK